MEARLLEVMRRFPVASFNLYSEVKGCPVYLKCRICANICFHLRLSETNFDFWANVFLLGNAEFT